MAGSKDQGQQDERAHTRSVHARWFANPTPGRKLTAMRAADTDARAHEAQIAFYRRLSPAERVGLAVEMSEQARAISLAGIRSRHPDYSPAQAHDALLRLLHGDDLYRRAWPGRPLLSP
jgi:hypothetical protein